MTGNIGEKITRRTERRRGKGGGAQYRKQKLDHWRREGGGGGLVGVHSVHNGSGQFIIHGSALNCSR